MPGVPKSCAALPAERMTRHGLVAPEQRSPLAATALTTAIQAQDAAAARLGVRARAAGSSDADVRAAIEDDRSIVRTWLMRGTIHLVATEDLRWLVRLIGPSVQRRYRTRWRQLGLADDLLDRVVMLLPEILADGPLPRAAIGAGLAERGIMLPDGDPQAPTHALVYASTCGLICRGPDRGRDATFTLLDRWLPGAPAGPDGDDALAELARRYSGPTPPPPPATSRRGRVCRPVGRST